MGAADSVAPGKEAGEGEGLGEGVGVGVAFFWVVDLLRCLRGLGVGLAKIFFNLSKNDSPPSWAPLLGRATPMANATVSISSDRSRIFR